VRKDKKEAGVGQFFTKNMHIACFFTKYVITYTLNSNTKGLLRTVKLEIVYIGIKIDIRTKPAVT